MVKSSEATAKLVQVKLALARKYDNRAKAAHSVPNRKTFLYHVARFRRQAADLAKQ